MKIAPLTTFLMLTASVESAAPVASADPRIPTWNSTPAPASAAPAAPDQQPDILPPHASGPGKPAYVDYYNNPNVIKNEGPRKQGQKRGPVDAFVHPGLDKRDGPVHPGLDERQLLHMPLILADPGRPVHQNLWHEVYRVEHQAEKNLAKRGLPKLIPLPVYDAEGNAYLNSVMVKDVGKRGLPRLQPLPVYDAEGNAYINGEMIKDTPNSKREIKNPPKLEPQPKYDQWGNIAAKPKYGVDAIVPAKPGQNPPGVSAGKGKPSFKEWVETYGYENVPYKREAEGAAGAAVDEGEKEGHVEGKKIEARDPNRAYGHLIGAINAKTPPAKDSEGTNYHYPTHPDLDKRQDVPDDGKTFQNGNKTRKTCATKHNSSGGLARLHEVLTANHISEVEAELKEHGRGGCILAVEQLKETSTNSDGAIVSQITTQTTAIEPAVVKGNQNASHGLAPILEQQEAHHQHDQASGHSVVDHGGHGDGSVHDAVKEAEEAKKVDDKRKRREKRLLLIPQKKDMDKSLWIGVDGVAFKK